MNATSSQTAKTCCNLEAPRRNNYFHGKLLTADHFKRESHYLNAKRRLINRLVNGYGVVCGLNVKKAPSCKGLIIEPGVAIDPQGREIIVPSEHPVELDGNVETICSGELCEAHIVLCYCEYPDKPQPTPDEDCGFHPPPQPDFIREGYKIEIRSGHLPCPLPLPQKDLIDEIKGFQFHEHEQCPFTIELDFAVHYQCLVHWISQECFCPDPTDTCIALANIELECRKGKWQVVAESIDITVRPIVYTNDLLRHLLYSLARTEGQYDQLHKPPQHK